MLWRSPVLAALLCWSCYAQQPAPPAGATPATARADQDRHDHDVDRMLKAVDNQAWYSRLGDIADVDEVAYTSLPASHVENKTAPGAVNPLIIHAYTFIPKRLDRSRKQPLLVFAHGGVHSNFSADTYQHIVREMIGQGYSVIAPDYRGSTGYGGEFYRQIDYGGRENDDVFAARNWMLETYSFLDPKRVGMLGWSHGGMITLMNVFQHPEAYAAAYAGVPVSDLVTRMGYHDAAYQALFSAPYHIGKTVRGDIQEYLRRSPITYVDRLATPLLIHTNTNDEDVNVLEVQRLIAALKAAGKKFEYKIYPDAPGGHEFNRIDTKLARDSRQEVYRFIAGYLSPERPPK